MYGQNGASQTSESLIAPLKENQMNKFCDLVDNKKA